MRRDPGNWDPVDPNLTTHLPEDVRGLEIDGSIVSVAVLARFTGEAGFPGMANSLTQPSPPNIANSRPQLPDVKCKGRKPIASVGRPFMVLEWTEVSLVCIILHRVYLKLYK